MAKDARPYCAFGVTHGTGTWSGDTVLDLQPHSLQHLEYQPDTATFDQTMLGPYDAVLTGLLTRRYDISYRQNASSTGLVPILRLLPRYDCSDVAS